MSVPSAVRVLPDRSGAVHRFGRNHDRLSLREHGSSRSGFGISRAQMARLVDRFSLQQLLGMLGGQPSAFLRDPDGHDFVFVLVNRIENGRSRQQRDSCSPLRPPNKMPTRSFSYQHGNKQNETEIELHRTSLDPNPYEIS